MRVVGDGGMQSTAAAASLCLARATPRWRVFAARVTPARASCTLAAEEAASTRSQTRTAQFSTVYSFSLHQRCRPCVPVGAALLCSRPETRAAAEVPEYTPR